MTYDYRSPCHQQWYSAMSPCACVKKWHGSDREATCLGQWVPSVYSCECYYSDTLIISFSSQRFNILNIMALCSVNLLTLVRIQASTVLSQALFVIVSYRIVETKPFILPLPLGERKSTSLVTRGSCLNFVSQSRRFELQDAASRSGLVLVCIFLKPT